MKRKFLRICFMALVIMGFGCGRKECRDMSLPSMECGNEFDNDYSYKYYAFSDDPFNMPTKQIILVNNDSTYKALFSTTTRNKLGTIDFTKNMLIGTCITTGAASSYKSQGFLCKNRTQNKWKYTVQYSLSGQCKGSGISNLYLSAWLLGPKLPAGASIDLDIKNVNPL